MSKQELYRSILLLESNIVRLEDRIGKLEAAMAVQQMVMRPKSGYAARTVGDIRRGWDPRRLHG